MNVETTTATTSARKGDFLAMGVYHQIETNFLPMDIGTLSKEEFHKRYQLVATVDTEDLDQAYADTQNLNQEWWKNESIMFSIPNRRSTSVNDILVIGYDHNQAYKVDFAGFSKISITTESPCKSKIIDNLLDTAFATEKQPKTFTTELAEIKTYEDWKRLYERAFSELFNYHPDQVGSRVFSGQMADLADSNPDFLERFEEEVEKESQI